MNLSTIFSIGHGNKTLEKFIEELNAYKIEYVFDVRSKPYSKFNPHFNGNLLEAELLENDITYIYAGDYLGGLPNDISCYERGKVDYEKLKEKDFFKMGLNAIVEASREQMIVAIMCSETRPETCHRSKLIGLELLKHNVTINHIIDSDVIRDQYQIMNKFTQGKNLKNLFGEESFTSRKKY